MAKFIKSLFTPEKRLSSFEEEDEEVEPPVLDVRRKLSMSRSGRLKQSYKKRQQLSIAAYDVEDLHEPERPKSLEYHVNKPVTPKIATKQAKLPNERTKPSNTAQTDKHDDSKSPEEEIDDAFEIIDKS